MFSRSDKLLRLLGVITLGIVLGLSCASPKKPQVVTEPPPPPPPPEEVVPPPEPEETALVLHRINFDFDRAEVRSGDAGILQSNAEVLKIYSDVKVLVEGHTCPIGTSEYNLALGERRARVTRDYLVNLGITPNRLSIISYGEERPIDSRDYPPNRRAEFVVK